jgi:hypothetical protein
LGDERECLHDVVVFVGDANDVKKVQTDTTEQEEKKKNTKGKKIDARFRNCLIN